MIYLKIDNGKGYFLNAKNSMQEIHEIRKEDILRLLDIATDGSVDFEMDEIKDGNIRNEAHRIIYDSIHIGNLSESSRGWTKELNIISWNGGVPKLDIRDWAPEHEKMGKGITLSEEEAEKLAGLLRTLKKA